MRFRLKGSTSIPMIAGLVIVLLIMAAFFVSRSISSKRSADYVAVFLINGQVYFGKLASSEQSNPVILHDVYYPQVQQTNAGQADDASKNQGQLQLIKMGNETHGPKDEIRINRDHVAYVEDLKEEGVVVKSIRSFQANGGKPVGAAPSAVTNPTATPSAPAVTASPTPQ